MSPARAAAGRLVATLGCDLRLQLRNGFYWAAGFVALYLMVLLQWLERPALAWILPVGIFGNLTINTFYFFSGLVLLEKREGTLEAQVVTPLRTGEYLASKLVTLTALGVVENLAIVVVAYGPGFRALPLVAGMVLAGVVYCLAGFALVARYDSINEFLMPSFLVTLALALPILPYLGILEGWWILLHPLGGSLALLEAAFLPVPAARQAAAVVASLAWIVVAVPWSRSAFRRFIVVREGRRR